MLWPMTTTAISTRLANIIEQRQQRLPAVKSAVAAWSEVNDRLLELDGAVDDLVQIAPADMGPLRSALMSQDLKALVAENLRRLRVVEARFSRGSVNLGVSGQARVGKSTLLQAISGLSDEQVPTGMGHPVTAVRSQIFHSATQARAILTMHNYESFRDEVLASYHQVVGLDVPPRTLASFRRERYPATINEKDHPTDILSQRGLLKRLRGMQEGLSTYEDYLTGEELSVPLEELRRWIAYPVAEAATPPGRYLAVRAARIECKFPYAEVENLSLMDLPGLGELAAGAEQRHVQGLQNEVDQVLLIMRPQNTSAFVDKKTFRTLDLLHAASEAFNTKEDFVFLVVNDGEVEPKLVEALIGDIRDKMAEHEGIARYRVIRGDAKDPRSVNEKIMEPILEHLADRLGVMDREVLAHAWERTRGRGAIRRAMIELRKTLEELTPEMADVAEELIQRTAELRKDVAVSLHGVLETLFAAARSEDGDEEFASAVEDVAAEAERWIEEGFGLGAKKWMEEASRSIRAERGSGPLVTHELNRIRVEISEHFRNLDDFFARRLELLHHRIAKVLRESLGTRLVPEGRGTEALRHLLGSIRYAGVDACPSLIRTLDELVSLRLEYRSQLHPRVRRCLDVLLADYIDPRTGRPTPTLTASAEETEMLLRKLRNLTVQAVQQIKKELHRDVLFPAQVMHAAAEQFEDAFIRGGSAERELRTLIRAYRDDIWPGEFEGIDARNARVARVRQAIASVEESLEAHETIDLPRATGDEA
jgi:hypothetical protein